MSYSTHTLLYPSPVTDAVAGAGSYLYGPTMTHPRQLGYKQFELSNHTGNILMVVSDRKNAVDIGTWVAGSTAYNTASTEMLTGLISWNKENNHREYGGYVGMNPETGEIKIVWALPGEENELKMTHMPNSILLILKIKITQLNILSYCIHFTHIQAMQKPRLPPTL